MAKNESNEKVEEESFDEKKDKKSTFQRVMNIILWIVLFIWMGICLIDFFNAHNENDPIFCLSKETVKYDDGQVRICTGLGYKVFNYERASYKGIEYGPFWSSDRSAKQDK